MTGKAADTFPGFQGFPGAVGILLVYIPTFFSTGVVGGCWGIVWGTRPLSWLPLEINGFGDLTADTVALPPGSRSCKRKRKFCRTADVFDGYYIIGPMSLCTIFGELLETEVCLMKQNLLGKDDVDEFMYSNYNVYFQVSWQILILNIPCFHDRKTVSFPPAHGDIIWWELGSATWLENQIVRK